MTTAIILGSGRTPGNTHGLADHLARRLDARVFDLADFCVGHFDYDFGNRHDDFLPLMKELLGYEQLILASPVYWYAPSGRMKVFMDRLSDLLKTDKPLGRQLRSKRAALLATGSDTRPQPCFEQIFAHSFDYLSMDYQGMLYCACDEEFDVHRHQPAITAFIEDKLC